MADKVWNGIDPGNEGDLSVAANYTPSGVPISGDNIFFTTGTQAVTGGFSALTAVNPALVVLGPLYSGDFGNSAVNRVQIGNITDLRFDHGGVNAWLEAKTITACHVLGGLGLNNMLQFVDTGGLLDIQDMIVTGGLGNINIPDGSNFVGLRVSGVPGTNRIILGSSLTGFTGKVQADSGMIDFNSTPDDIQAYGTSIMNFKEGSGTIATLLRASGNSIINYDSDGNVTLAEVWGGALLDFRKNAAAGGVTFTTVKAYSNAVVDSRAVTNLITITNRESHGGGKFSEDLS